MIATIVQRSVFAFVAVSACFAQNAANQYILILQGPSLGAALHSREALRSAASATERARIAPTVRREAEEDWSRRADQLRLLDGQRFKSQIAIEECLRKDAAWSLEAALRVATRGSPTGKRA